MAIVYAGFIGGNTRLWPRSGKLKGRISRPALCCLLSLWDALTSARTSALPLFRSAARTFIRQEPHQYSPCGLEQATPLRRLADPMEIVWPAIWLCSDEASYMTGVVLPIEGDALSPEGEHHVLRLSLRKINLRTMLTSPSRVGESLDARQSGQTCPHKPSCEGQSAGGRCVDTPDQSG